MTDLDERLLDLARHAGQVAQPPAFDELRSWARARRHRRAQAFATAAAGLIALLVAAAVAWPPVSGPPAEDHEAPPAISIDRFLRITDFFQPRFQAVEDPGDRSGHPNCPGTESGPGRTARWREFRTFDQAVRAYQVAINYADSDAARRSAASVLDHCTGMLTGNTATSSRLTDNRGDHWRVRHETTRPFHGEVSVSARVGKVVTIVWIRGLHRVVTTDGYAQVILERMRARLAGTDPRFSTLPKDGLTDALLTAADARAATGRTRVMARHPAVFQRLHICQPVPHFVIRWRQVQYARYDWQPLVDERVSIASDIDAARRSWDRLITDITGCAATREQILPGPTLGDDGVLIGDGDASSSPTAVVRVGRVVVEIVLWDSNDLPPGQGPTTKEISDLVATALTRIRTHLPEEASGG